MLGWGSVRFFILLLCFCRIVLIACPMILIEFILLNVLKRLNGTSGPCDTFGNLCLAHSPEFDLKNVEVMFREILSNII